MPDQAVGLLSPWLRDQRFRAARPFIAGRVLDIGCGIGLLADIVPPERYIGMDIDEGSLETARRRHPRHRFVETWPPEGETFDTVVGLAVIEHIADPGVWLKRVAQSMSTNGKIVLTTPKPSVEWLHVAGARIGLFSHDASDEHEQLLDRKALEQLGRAAGLRMVHFSSFLLGVNQLVVFQ